MSETHTAPRDAARRAQRLAAARERRHAFMRQVHALEPPPQPKKRKAKNPKRPR